MIIYPIMELKKIEKELNENVDIDQFSIEKIRNKIFETLISEGFSIMDGKIISISRDKDFIRKLHSTAVLYLRDKKKDFINKVDDKFLSKYIIDGKDLDIKNIQPKLIQVNTEEYSNLFSWIKLHWSIPISSGYGRRLRYIVYDRGNSALIGIMGFADPVYGLKDRDNFIGWNYETKKKNLRHIMDAFVLGAVPPYTYVLGGKLVASLVMSPRIIKDFRNKYKGRKALISNEIFDGKLAAITTASALGKSSVYDRIKIPGSSEFLHVGWSKGSGEFQFFNGLYDEIFKIARHTALKSKNPKWGSGTRNRRTVMQAGFKILGLPETLLYHNIKRELFIIPLGKKSFEFLRDESYIINYFHLSEDEIVDYAIKRWVIPRSERDKKYLLFNKNSYALF